MVVGARVQPKPLGLVTPRLVDGPLQEIPPETLFGGSHVNVGQGSAPIDKTAAEYQVVGGIDMTIFPRLDWRMAEVSWGSVQNAGDVKPMTVTTGLGAPAAVGAAVERAIRP